MAGDVRQVHADARLTNVSVKYKNPQAIWRMVMPVTRVMKRSNKYSIFDKSNTYSVLDDSVSPHAMPNEIQWKVSEDNYSVEDRAFGMWVSNEEVENADAPLRPLMNATESLTDRLELAQERRVAQLIMSSSTYVTSRVLNLTGEARWNGNAAHPITNVLDVIERPLMHANTLVFGHEAWTAFRQHISVLRAVKGYNNSRDASVGGLATKDEVKALLGVDNILVGSCRYNSAKKGQTESFSYVWGKSVAALYVNPGPLMPNTITFGTTFVQSDRRVMRSFDPKPGVSGSHYIKASWNTDEKVIAQDLGALITTAVG